LHTFSDVFDFVSWFHNIESLSSRGGMMSDCLICVQIPHRAISLNSFWMLLLQFLMILKYAGSLWWSLTIKVKLDWSRTKYFSDIKASRNQWSNWIQDSTSFDVSSLSVQPLTFLQSNYLQCFYHFEVNFWWVLHSCCPCDSQIPQLDSLISKFHRFCLAWWCLCIWEPA
jgi:hypothetical protein